MLRAHGWPGMELDDSSTCEPRSSIEHEPVVAANAARPVLGSPVVRNAVPAASEPAAMPAHLLHLRLTVAPGCIAVRACRHRSHFNVCCMLSTRTDIQRVFAGQAEGL